MQGEFCTTKYLKKYCVRGSALPVRTVLCRPPSRCPAVPGDSTAQRVRRRLLLSTALPGDTSARGIPPKAPARRPAGARAKAKPAGPPMRMLAVDYGSSVTGLALGRDGIGTALKTIKSSREVGLSEVARQVLAEALKHGVEGLLVGIAVQPGGSILEPYTDSPVAARSRSLAHTLALMCKEHGLSVYIYNEYSTTRAAMSTLGYNWQDRMSGKDMKEIGVDAESAAMLLRLYYGNPRLAFRINPRPVFKRQPGQEE